MRAKRWLVLQLLFLLSAGMLLTTCDDKASEPEDGLNVSNDNPHCGLIAGFVRDASGEKLRGASISISPLPAARVQGTRQMASLSSFLNYPNPFAAHTYFAYYLNGAGPHTIQISIYNLHHISPLL